jgi:hypothetical protein
MTAAVEPESTDRSRAFLWLREAFAITLWSWSAVKLFVFDLDIYLLQRFAPSYLWLLRYKLLIVLALISLVWLLLRQKSYYEFLLYIMAYPAVLFWKGLKLLYRHWPLLIAFAPPLYLFFQRARATFALYSLATICAVVLLITRSEAVTLATITLLLVFLAVHFARRLREALGANAFRELARVTRSLESRVLGYAFAAPNPAVPRTVPADPQTERLSQCYVFYAIAEVIGTKVGEIARGRTYDVYLLLSWLYTAFLTTFVYTFEYFGLNRAIGSSFRNATGAGFGQFFGFSLGVMTTHSVSEIVPLSPVARWLTYSEVLCSALVLFVLVFSLWTSARESYRQDAADFREALLGIAGAIEQKAIAAYQLTAPEMEKALLAQHAVMVNFFRRQRGAGELPVPKAAIDAGLAKTPPASPT